MLRRDEFLERPTTLEPPTATKCRVNCANVVVLWYVRQEDNADFGAAVPLVHGVYGLGQLGAALLIDAGGVNPDVLEAFATGRFARLPDLVAESTRRIPDV